MDYSKLVRDEEGCELKMYKCTEGFHTIGWGFNLDANPIPQEVADLLLKYSMEQSIKDAKRIFTNFDKLSEVRRSLLVNMSYQLGLNRLYGFKNFIAAVLAENWQLAKKEMLDSKWAKQTPKRANRMASIMQRGEW